ncbi:MAG: hypothetical protein KKB37_01230 [Alphaproteobacteria bacterium]|nr:hypothetical protein [Alphaproteobacteria bacterium]
MGITFVDFMRHRLDGLGHARLRPARLLHIVVVAMQVHHERRQLAQLGRGELAEMGIDPGAAMAEANRGFFDLPKSRMTKI